jgi:hypothetical protein
MKWIQWMMLMISMLTLTLAANAAESGTPPDRDVLSRDLARALQFYYDGDYARALPIFKNLSDQMETIDLLFWTGTSAARAGECDLAVEKLQEILENQPDLLRARLELGITHYRCGNPEKATAEFEAMLARSPSPEVRNTVNSYLTRIEKGEDALYWGIRFSQGYKYDDNITSGPDEAVIDDGNIPLFLSQGVREQSGDNWVTGLRADLLYDLGQPGGFLWNGGLDFYYSHSFEDSVFNYMKTDLFTGPWWRNDNQTVQAPFGFTWQRYAGDSLSGTFHLTPSYERLFSPSIGLAASYRLEVERYDEDRYTDAGYDNENHTFALGPNFYVMDGQYLISGRVAYERHEADADRYSFDAAHLWASFFTTFKTNTELFFLYKWSDKTYDGPAVTYSNDREDTRHTLLGVVAQNFLEHYFAACEIAYVRNRSNADLYDFDKTSLTLSLGLNY